MDILKAATTWAKAELVSTPFFMLFGLVFIAGSIGFWHFGKTELAKAYILPTLIAGILLLTIGLGLFYTNSSRLKQFKTAYHTDASAFVSSEIERTESTLKEYQTIVFKIIPLLIIVAALFIMYTDNPTWRAISITTIAMLIVILLIDGTAHARIQTYHQALTRADMQPASKK